MRFRLLCLNTVELVSLLDLSCEDLLNVYEAFFTSNRIRDSGDHVECFCAEVSGFLSNRTYHYRVKNCPEDSVWVLERALRMKSFDIVNVSFVVREGFFDQLRFTNSLYKEGNRVNEAPIVNDPMPDHYLVKEDYLLHWFIKNGFTQTAIYQLKQRPVKCTFGYAPTWADRSVGKSIFTLVLEQSKIDSEDKSTLVQEIERAMADSCLEL